jgi:hypothetical protein
MIFNYSLTYKHNPNNYLNHPVAVIANFSNDGRFIPVYFRFVADDSLEFTYKINAIKSIKDKHDSISFCCAYTNEGHQYQVILTFQISECLWILNT